MNFIPKSLLKRIYTRGSLTQNPDGLSFNIKNRLADARFKKLIKLEIDGVAVPLEDIFMDFGQGEQLTAPTLNEKGFFLKMGQSFDTHVQYTLAGQSNIELTFEFDTESFGKVNFKISDIISLKKPERENKIPRIPQDDYSKEAIEKRQKFVEKLTGTDISLLVQAPPSDKNIFRGNIENLTGFAQVPIGIAGPVTINGEHAKGAFLAPLATTEGTLTASYNKGIKLINEAGGANCRVVSDSMQRAPVFIFESVKEATLFARWLKTVDDQFKELAESTSNHLKYLKVEIYQAANNVFLRFNFFTGDAAGQNMVSKAAFVVCQWVLENFEGIANFYLESNMATDKKHSFINSLHSRGKKVIAEVTISEEMLLRHFGVDFHQFYQPSKLTNLGGMMAGVNNNGLHMANALAALFIALGQDPANVAESAAGFIYCEIIKENRMYLSVTFPALIIGTVGGGTGLPTQKTCLQMMDCYGVGKAKKLAEIIAGIVLAGEISLAGAAASLDWVAAHESIGKNRQI